MTQQQFARLINNAASVADRLEAEGNVEQARAIDALIDAFAFGADISG